MKAQILKAEIVEATQFSHKATVLTLSGIPSIEEQNILFGVDESMILEF